MDDLDAIDAQVKALEAQLNQAKARREAEARKRREADDLQRQIDELESQLQGVSDSPEYQTNLSFQVQLNDKPPSRPTRLRSVGHPQLPEGKPNATTTPYSPSTQTQSQTQIENAIVRPQNKLRSDSSSSPTIVVPVVGASEQAKRHHHWSKPDWALPSTAIPDDAIQNESIVNPLLKSPPKSNAYERKVKPKELELIRGNFVAPQGAKLPDPRLVWIVVNVDGCKLGKIVMHLAGTNIDPMSTCLQI